MGEESRCRRKRSSSVMRKGLTRRWSGNGYWEGREMLGQR